jgi:hypothetical protein
MADVDRHSVDGRSLSEPDSLFSSPEPEGPAIDSDTSISYTHDRRGGALTSSHLVSHNRTGPEADQGKVARLRSPHLVTYQSNLQQI